jgi:hypothetical protein
MIHYKVQLKNDVSQHMIDIIINENAKRYRIYWMTNHCGMFMQYLISQHKNFPQSSAYYITLPDKAHVIYKTDGQDPDTLVEPINNLDYTKFIDSNPNGMEPWHMNNQTDVQFYIEPSWPVANMRNDTNEKSPEQINEDTFMTRAEEVLKIPDSSFCIVKLFNPETRANEYAKLLNIIEEEPIEIDSMIEDFKKHIEWTL